MPFVKAFRAFFRPVDIRPEHGPPAPETLPPGDFSILRDDFLGWLRFVNAGMLDNGNIVAMDHAIANMPAGAVIEIGSFCGLSANVITHLLRRHQRTAPFFSCDPWLFEGADTSHTPMGDGGITFGEYRELVRTSFIRNVQAFSRHQMPHALEMISDTFFEYWENDATVKDVFGRTTTAGGPIAFAYIDGDHRYDQARRDFENVDRHLAPGGFILFDDSADFSGWEVCRLVQELNESSPSYTLTGKYPNYLFQKHPAA
jgi:hypothetical protein